MKKYTVYKHIVPNGKIYVGITSRKLYEAWKDGLAYSNNDQFFRDIVKYGWDNIQHKAICELTSKEDALAKKKELISLDDYYPDDCYNERGMSDLVKEKIRKTMAEKVKAIDQYTLDGEHIATYDSGRDAERKTGIHGPNINACCRGVAKTAGGYVWRYEDE